MADPSEVKAVIKSIRQFGNFRAMAQYNISCLLTFITPPTVGWRENVAAAVEDGGIESIISVLAKHGDSLDMIKQATTSLSGLAISRGNAGKVATNGGIETAVKCMLNLEGNTKEQNEVIDSGSKLMETVARFNPESVIQSPNAISSMLTGVNHGGLPRVQTASAKVLDRVAVNDVGLQMIVSQGGIQALIDAIAPGKQTHEAMLTPTFRLLERLARNPDFVSQIRNAGGVEALVAQLDAHSDNEFILRAGGRLLAKIADGDIEETIRRMGANLPDSVRQHLVGLLANLALQPENVDKIVKNHGIEALIRGFKNYNPATKAAALRMIQRVADTGAQNVDQILKAGGLPIIIDAIRNANGNEDILKAGAQALTSIAGTGLDYANMVHQQGGIDALLQSMLAHPNLPGFASAGLDFLDKLCGIGFDINQLLDMGAIGAIQAAMAQNPESAEVQEKGFKALESLMSSPDVAASGNAARALLGSGSIGPLVAQAMQIHEEDRAVVQSGLATVAKLLTLESKADLGADANGSMIKAIFQQLKMKMLNKGKFASNPTYDRNVKALLAKLGDPKYVAGLPQALVNADDNSRPHIIKQMAVYAVHKDLGNVLVDSDIAKSLAKSLQQVSEGNVANQETQIADAAVAIWSTARNGLDAMADLAEQGAMKNLLSAVKIHSKKPEVAISCLRGANGFASSLEFKDRLVQAGAIETAVTAMRSNPTDPDVQEAAIDFLSALSSSSEAAASQIAFKGGIKQLNKMILESSASPEFEKAVEQGMKLMYKVSAVDKNEVREQLKKAGTVNTATTAMSAFPSNEEILELGGRVLATLMDTEDVANAIDEVKALTSELQSAPKPDKVFQKLGQKAATVGFLSLNPKNKQIMEEKETALAAENAVKVSKSKPLTTRREAAVRNEYRAMGQIASTISAPSNLPETLLEALKEPTDSTALLEKVGVLDAIKYMASDPDYLKQFMSLGAVDAITALLAGNRQDDDTLLAAINSLSALMATDSGVQLVTKAGGRDLILGVLKDDAEHISPKVAAAALVALKKLATLEFNAIRLADDGVVDAVTSTLAIQCEQSEQPRPKVLAASAALLNQLCSNGGESDQAIAEQIVRKDALKKLIEITSSSPEYLGSLDCINNLSNLFESLANVDDLLDKMRELGAVELLMNGMNLHPGNDELEATGQKVLQKLIGGHVSGLETTLTDYDKLLKAVSSRPNNTAALERLNRAGANLGNLMMVEGVVDANGAKEIASRALDTFDIVNSKVPDSVGPIKEQLLDTALQTVGRATLVDGAMESIDLDRVLNALAKAMENSDYPLLQAQAIGALGKFINEDERFLQSAIKFGLISKLAEVGQKTTSPEVKDAVEKALKNVRDNVLQKPKMLLSPDGSTDASLAALIKTVTDPRDLESLLNAIAQSPNGADALFRLAMDDFNIPGESNEAIRKDLLKALGNLPQGMFTIPPDLLKSMLEKLSDPTVSADEKAALLALISANEMTPASVDALLQSNAIDHLLSLISDKNNTDPNLVAAAMHALGEMAKNPELAQKLLELNGSQQLIESMMRFEDNKKLQEEGFNALANLKETAGGPEKIMISPDALQYLEGALAGLDGPYRKIADDLVNDLENLYNGQLEPMVVSRFDNMLEVLNAAKDWREIYDPKSGKPYYHNLVTGETTWTKPAALIAAEGALQRLQELAQQAPAEIDQEKLRAAIGHFDQYAAQPLRLKALAQALTALATNEKNREAMVNNGVLGALLKALNGKNIDREFILAAIALLNQFAKHKVFKEKICQMGGIRALIAIMLRFIQDEEIVEKCEQCLANLAFQSPPCVAEIMACQGPQAVGKALSSHKQSINVSLHGMTLISNIMFKNKENKDIIGQVLREKIVAVLRRMYKEADVFKQTARAIGNIAFIDDHIRFVVRLNAVKSLIVAMNHHKNDKSITKIGIDVIGNFASVDEDDYREQIRKGEIVSVLSTIWHEGGAKKIVDTFQETTDPLLISSCAKSLMHLLEDDDVRRKLIDMDVVQLIFSSLRKYDWDTNISDFCIDSIDLLSSSKEGVRSLYENDGVPLLLSQLEENMERVEYVETLAKTLVKMGSLRDMHAKLSVDVLMSVYDQKGIDSIVKVMDANVHQAEFCKISLKLLHRMTALQTDVSLQVAKIAMRVILKIIHEHKDDVKVLYNAYEVIGLLAFEEPNLKIIVQFGGIDLLVGSILSHPGKEKLVQRAIQTLDIIAMASNEHSHIVRQARGKDVVEELIKSYSSIPGPESEKVIRACKAALLSMNKIETRMKQPRPVFDRGYTDPTVDPLKKFRNLLLNGETVTLWKGNSHKSVHLKTKQLLEIVWKAPGGKKFLGKIHLKNVTLIKRGNQQGHGRKSVAANAFAIATTDSKKLYCFECKDAIQRNLWVDGFEALKKEYRGDRKWLKDI